MKQFIPSPKCPDKDGSILLTILMVMLILSITMGSLLTLSSQYFYSTQHIIDSEAAFYLAEAGIEAACSYVTEIGSLLPNSYSDSGTVGDGSFEYTITKTDFYECDIVATGEVNGKKRSIELEGVRSATYAKFAFFAEDNGSIYFKSGEEFFGHIHTDTTPWFSGDPIFNDIFTTKADGYEGETNSVTFKEGFKTNKDMGSMADVDFDSMKTFAQNYPDDALLLTGETAIEFDGEQVLITNADKGWEKEAITLSEEQMIYVQSGSISGEQQFINVGEGNGDYKIKNNGDYKYVGFTGKDNAKFIKVTGEGEVFINGGTLDGRLTLVSENDISINDHIVYSLDPLDEDAVNEAIAEAKAEAIANGTEFDKDAVVNDALGLISGDDVIITGSAPDDIYIHATIMATGAKSSDEGSFYVYNYKNYDPRGYINLLGGIVQEERGAVGSFNSKTGKTSASYDKKYTFDTRFESKPPPYFPPLQSGLTYESWQEIVAN
ncbi:pilus assembly PilX N-terminal domain-containing protein [Pontiellaceae bacterium B12219]|nr:pilus assembly PilX N-terminal domain-containing protein [Pontiellaceae bacterium B12219]